LWFLRRNPSQNAQKAQRGIKDYPPHFCDALFAAKRPLIRLVPLRFILLAGGIASLIFFMTELKLTRYPVFDELIEQACFHSFSK
jgi:hypothetical protein